MRGPNGATQLSCWIALPRPFCLLCIYVQLSEIVQGPTCCRAPTCVDLVFLHRQVPDTDPILYYSVGGQVPDSLQLAV